MFEDLFVFFRIFIELYFCQKMSEKKKRSHDDDDKEPIDDIDQLLNRTNLNRQLANSYKTRDQQYKQRLDTLNSQLKQLYTGIAFFYYLILLMNNKKKHCECRLLKFIWLTNISTFCVSTVSLTFGPCIPRYGQSEESDQNFTMYLQCMFNLIRFFTLFSIL